MTERPGAETLLTASRSAGVRREPARGIMTTFPDAEPSPARSVNAIVPLLPVSALLYAPRHSPTSGLRSKSLEVSSIPGFRVVHAMASVARPAAMTDERHDMDLLRLRLFSASERWQQFERRSSQLMTFVNWFPAVSRVLS